jgi:hypothetical protein
MSFCFRIMQRLKQKPSHENWRRGGVMAQWQTVLTKSKEERRLNNQKKSG